MKQNAALAELVSILGTDVPEIQSQLTLAEFKQIVQDVMLKHGYTLKFSKQFARTLAKSIQGKDAVVR